MVKQVLLCGCGNIGFRHLQAMSVMETSARITIVEPFEDGHARIADFIASQNDVARYRLLAALPGTRERFDLVVIATSADTRQAAFDGIVDTHDVGCIIFEKILFQSITAMDAVAARLDRIGIPAFVNCGRRGFDSYRALAATLQGPTDITVRGSAFGLASNAVHFLDLAEFLNSAALTAVDLSGLAPGAIESKRAGFFEIFGTLAATLDNGAMLSVTCANTDIMQIDIILRSDGRTITIDELGGTQAENGTTTPFGIKYVSGMPYLYDAALQTGDAGLTPFADSAHQHRLYLRAMCQHLGLPGGNDTVCPIS